MLCVDKVPRSFIELKIRLSAMRKQHQMMHRSDVEETARIPPSPPPFLTQAELINQIKAIPENLIETTDEIEEGKAMIFYDTDR